MIFGGFPGFPKDLSHECEKKKKKKKKAIIYPRDGYIRAMVTAFAD